MEPLIRVMVAPLNYNLGAVRFAPALMSIGMAVVVRRARSGHNSERKDPSPNDYAPPLPRPPFTVTTFSGSCFTSTTMPKNGAIISSQV